MPTIGFWNLLGIGLCVFFIYAGQGVYRYLRAKEKEPIDTSETRSKEAK